MGKDREVNIIYTVLVLAALVIGAVYWTGKLVEGNAAYTDSFSGAMDAAIDQAYGLGVKDK